MRTYTFLPFLAILSFLLLINSDIYGRTIEPQSAYTARNGYFIVGDLPQGQPAVSDFLSIKEGTSDRVVLEYDLTGQYFVDHAVLDFRGYNSGNGESTLYFFAFQANGVVNADDYYISREHDFAGSVNFPLVDYVRRSYTLDITLIFNQCIAENYSHLGILVVNEAGDRCHIFGPVITTTVPQREIPPVADAGTDQTIYAFIDGHALVQLDGTGSYDKNGDALEYYWYNANELIAEGVEPSVVLPVGEHVIHLIVNDGVSDSEPNSCMITVVEAFEVPGYTITEVSGTDGYTYYVQSINENGYVTGLFEPDPKTGAYYPFWWDGVSMHHLGTLGGNKAEGTDINNTGSIVGFSLIANDSRSPQHAFIYDGATMRDLGTLGGICSLAFGINDAGHVVGSSDLDDGGSCAFLYDGTTMHDLGSLGGRYSGAVAVNNRGFVTGSSYYNSLDEHAFLYDGTTMHDLGTLGGRRSWGKDINNHGHVVGISWTGRSGLGGFYYDGTAMHDIGSLGGDSTYAEAINDNGCIVGRSELSGGGMNAYIYNGQDMFDLNDLIPAGSGWKLTMAFDINNAGQIVGRGIRDGQMHAYLLTPVPESVPPVADAGSDQIVYAFVDGYALVQLDGTNSCDEDGDALEYDWYDANGLIAEGAEPNVLLPVGKHVINLVVNDGTTDSEPSSCIIIVVEALYVNVKLTPKAVNRKSHRPHIVGWLELAGLTEAVLDPNEPMVLMPGDISAQREKLLPGKNGLVTLKGFFDFVALMEAIGESGDVEVTLATKLMTGQWVFGKSYIRVH